MCCLLLHLEHIHTGALRVSPPEFEFRVVNGSAAVGPISPPDLLVAVRTRLMEAQLLDKSRSAAKTGVHVLSLAVCACPLLAGAQR